MSPLKETRDWLESEGEDGPSETGLTSLMRHLPDLSAPDGLADAILRDLGLSAAHRPLRPSVWGARVGIAACLFLASCLFLLLPLLRLVPLPGIGDFVGLSVAAAHVLSIWWSVAVSIWGFLFAFAEKATLLLTAPEAVAGLALTAAVGLLAFRWLLSLTSQLRSSGYAETV